MISNRDPNQEGLSAFPFTQGLEAIRCINVPSSLQTHLRLSGLSKSRLRCRSPYPARNRTLLRDISKEEDSRHKALRRSPRKSEMMLFFQKLKTDPQAKELRLRKTFTVAEEEERSENAVHRHRYAFHSSHVILQTPTGSSCRSRRCFEVSYLHERTRMT